MKTTLRETSLDPTEMKIFGGVSTVQIRKAHTERVRLIGIIKIVMDHRIFADDVLEGIYSGVEDFAFWLKAMDAILEIQPDQTFEELKAEIRSGPQGRGRPLGDKAIQQILNLANKMIRGMNKQRTPFRIYHSMKFADVFAPVPLPDGFPPRPDKKAA